MSTIDKLVCELVFAYLDSTNITYSGDIELSLSDLLIGNHETAAYIDKITDEIHELLYKRLGHCIVTGEVR